MEVNASSISSMKQAYTLGYEGDKDEVIRKYQYDFERGF